MPLVLALATVALEAFACGASDAPAPPAPLVSEAGCQPLLASDVADESSRARCLLPYPSSFWMTDDGAAPSGKRMRLADPAKPRLTNGRVSDPHDARVYDGASTAPMLVATLPGDLSRDGLPRVDDPFAVSEGPTSPTVILEVATGRRIPHYVDLFDSTKGEPYEPIVLRPLVALTPKSRYVIALRGVRAAEGDALAPPAEGFRRLRDRLADPVTDKVAGAMESTVFEPLARAGIARDTLQLAWEVTTGSVESETRDLLRVRELTLAALAAGPPKVRVTESTDGARGFARIVRLAIEVPKFVTSLGADGALTRDASGAVVQSGVLEIAAIVCVPTTTWASGPPGRALAYGHGFFGGTDEVESETGRKIAERLRAVTFGTTWTGMSKDDLGAIVGEISSSPETLSRFAERVHQAMASWIVLTEAMQRAVADLPELRRPDGSRAYDPSAISYFGASQGHILGSVLLALSPHMQRAIFNVGGGGFAHMFPRSTNFGAFALALDLALGDARVSQAYLSMFQRAVDGIDGGFWAPFVLREPLAGSPPGRRVLMQIGLGDSAVPNAASFYHARALGLRETTPSPRRVPGLEETPGGAGVNALTVFDYGVDTSSPAPRPTGPNAVHDGLRLNERALRQMESFLAPDGQLVHPCDGPCDPE